MLFISGMKTTLRFVLASLLAACGSSSSTVVKGNAPIGPDYVSSAPKLHIDRSLVASDAMNRISPLDVVAFDQNSHRLADATYAQVDRAAQWLLRHPSYMVVLEGHTSALGVQPYNEDLAQRRMHEVRHRLMAAGIPNDRILMLTYGERDAIAPNNPADRRVVMFATQLEPQQIVAMQMEHRPALIASWVEDGALMQLTQGVGDQPTGVISRR